MDSIQNREDLLPDYRDGGLLDQIEIRILEIGGQKQDIGEMLEFFPLTHTFTPGLYSRQIFMPAGSMLTSKIHKTEHQFIVSSGRVTVYSESGSVETLSAPHIGITKPGTRRFLLVHEDTTWTTFHANPKGISDWAEMEAELVERRENPLIAEKEALCQLQP